MVWRDPRHRVEIEADTQYARFRGAAGRLDAVLARGVREGKRMSLLGKLQHLTATAQDFHKETEDALDGIAAKIEIGRRKRDAAVSKHHAYYDEIITGVDESLGVIDRLSNGPLPGAGETSGG